MMKNGLHIDKDGDKAWYKDDRLHRDGGPAAELNDGTKMWCVNGKRHRIDGPAIEYADGSKSWFLEGERLGFNDEGFWALWDRLTGEQRNNLNLLMHLPGVQN